MGGEICTTRGAEPEAKGVLAAGTDYAVGERRRCDGAGPVGLMAGSAGGVHGRGVGGGQAHRSKVGGRTGREGGGVDGQHGVGAAVAEAEAVIVPLVECPEGCQDCTALNGALQELHHECCGGAAAAGVGCGYHAGHCCHRERAVLVAEGAGHAYSQTDNLRGAGVSGLVVGAVPSTRGEYFAGLDGEVTPGELPGGVAE